MVAKVAEALGTPLMPWQQMVADVACEIDPVTGLFAYREVILTVPRQSGKTTLILAKCTHRCLAWQRQVVMYAAQTRNDSRKKWEDDYLETLKGSVFANRFRDRKTNGNEAIIWHSTRSRFGISSTTEKAGHGSTLDEGYIDEAFAQQDARLEQAFKPAMITRRNAQLWVVSTAGTPKSLYLLDKVAAGRQAVEAGTTHGICYFEWSADEDETDYGNPLVWRECMPALHWPDCPAGCRDHTVYEDAIAADYLSMPINEFRRAYLNQWCDEVEHVPVIPAEWWARQEDPRSEAVGAVAFAVAMDPERKMVSIAAAGRRPAGGHHVEIVENRPNGPWVVPRLVELTKRHENVGVYLDKRSAAGGLLPRLDEEGVRVVALGSAEYAQACGEFFDSVKLGRVWHRFGSSFASVLAQVCTKNVGDSWGWDRRGPGVDITPLDATTIALYASVLNASSLAVINNVW